MTQSIPRGSAAPSVGAVIGPSSPPADQTTLSSSVIYRGGQLKVVYEELNALDGGSATPLVRGSAANQGAALQSLVNLVAPVGGVLRIPRGTYHMGSTAISAPPGPGFQIVGDETFNYSDPSVVAVGTTLQWDSDTANGPETTAALQLQTNQKASHLSLLGPLATGANNNGCRPCAFSGLGLDASCGARQLLIYNWGAGILWGGGGHTGADHCRDLGEIGMANVGWGFFVASGVNAGGDFALRNSRIIAQLAAFGQAAGSACLLQGATFKDGGLYGPYAFMRWDDGSGAGGHFLTNVNLDGCSVESPGNGIAYDMTYLLAGGGKQGSIDHCQFGHGMAGNLAGDRNWTGTCTVIGSGASQITVQVPHAGFVFIPGMTVSDGGVNIPAGTTVTSIAAGSWSTSGTAQYTLNLSANPTGTPATVTITAPRVGKYVAGSVYDNRFEGTVAASTVPFIVYGTGAACFGNSAPCGDDTLAICQAASSKMVSYAGTSVNPNCRGNDWGSRAPGGESQTSMMVESAVTVNQNDLVEMYAGSAMPTVVRPAAGTGPIVGVAQKTVTGVVQAVDIVRGGVGITVHNKGASNILTGALLKLDTANPGGVATASSMTDGRVIGQAESAINAGLTGTALVDIDRFGKG